MNHVNLNVSTEADDDEVDENVEHGRYDFRDIVIHYNDMPTDESDDDEEGDDDEECRIVTIYHTDYRGLTNECMNVTETNDNLIFKILNNTIQVTIPHKRYFSCVDLVYAIMQANNWRNGGCLYTYDCYYMTVIPI
ncbi:MAG: hypothetical protein EOO46_20530 [Flavobacterium sp.]|nr:MAG: hypothetical protein EOO46_20530 [Flavobacterium sp.]